MKTESKKMALVQNLQNMRDFERSLVAGYLAGSVSESAYISAINASESAENACLEAGITRKDVASV